MKRQVSVFLFASALIALFGLTLVPRTLADLVVFYPTLIDMNNVVVTLNPGESSETTPVKLESAKEIIAQRLKQLKLDEPYTIQVSNNQLELVLPRSADVSYISHLVSHVGEIEFVFGDTDVPAIGRQVATSRNPEPANDMPVYKTLFTGHEIAEVIPPGGARGDIFYQITLSPSVVAQFDNVNLQQSNFICIVLDNEVTHCSTMYHLADNTLDLLLNVDTSTNIDPIDLAVLLNSGPLPISLEVVGN